MEQKLPVTHITLFPCPALCFPSWLLPGYSILPLPVEKSKSQSTWPLSSRHPRLLEEEGATWQLRSDIQPLELQPGACGAHRELFFSKDKTMGTSAWSLLLAQTRTGLCVHHNPGNAAQKIHPAAAEIPEEFPALLQMGYRDRLCSFAESITPGI